MDRKAGSEPKQLEQLDRLLVEASRMNFELDVVKRAVEIADSVLSYKGRRLLERARDHLEDAGLLIREAQSVVAKEAGKQEKGA